MSKNTREEWIIITKLLVQFLDLKIEFTPASSIEISFIKMGNRSDLWAWDFRQWMEVNSVHQEACEP
jgi:hypothetical protein